MNTIQSTVFVTVLAWTFIALSGAGVLICLLQNIIAQLMYDMPEFQEALQAPMLGAPPFMNFITANFKWLVAVSLVVGIVSLVASIGLLKRKNWARLIIVGLLILGIVSNLAGIVLQFMALPSMRTEFSAIPDAPDMSIFLIAITVFGALIAIAFSVLFGWIAKRLLSPSIAGEFTQ